MLHYDNTWLLYSKSSCLTCNNTGRVASGQKAAVGATLEVLLSHKKWLGIKSPKMSPPAKGSFGPFSNLTALGPFLQSYWKEAERREARERRGRGEGGENRNREKRKGIVCVCMRMRVHVRVCVRGKKCYYDHTLIFNQTLRKQLKKIKPKGKRETKFYFNPNCVLKLRYFALGFKNF